MLSLVSGDGLGRVSDASTDPDVGGPRANAAPFFQGSAAQLPAVGQFGLAPEAGQVELEARRRVHRAAQHLVVVQRRWADRLPVNHLGR